MHFSPSFISIVIDGLVCPYIITSPFFSFGSIFKSDCLIIIFSSYKPGETLIKHPGPASFTADYIVWYAPTKGSNIKFKYNYWTNVLGFIIIEYATLSFYCYH